MRKTRSSPTWGQALGFGTIRLSHFCLARVKRNLFRGRRCNVEEQSNNEMFVDVTLVFKSFYVQILFGRLKLVIWRKNVSN